MAKENVLFGSALLDDGDHAVSIDDIDRSFTRLHRFYCPHCHKEMYATFGKIQQSHFRHNGDKCQPSKYLHDLAEYVFLEEYRKCLESGLPFYLELRVPMPCNEACVLKKHSDCRDHYLLKTVDLTKEYTRISPEAKVDINNRFRRPDILLESMDGKQLWIEIWVSHETELEKRKDGRIIEIKIDSEKDLDRIRRHKIIQSEEGDLAVRIFGIEANDEDALFSNDDDDSNISYPCEKYFCFEAGSSGYKTEVLDSIRTATYPGLKYRCIMRLNWRGQHDSTEGAKGKQTTIDELRSTCIQRYSLAEGSPLYQGQSYDSLIMFEWKSPDIELPQHSTVLPQYQTSNKFPSRPPIPTQLSSNMDLDDVEWVDLGLPSGTLWAKEDTGGMMSFASALWTYGGHIPSRTDADELQECCTKVWDEDSNALVFTGPSGQSISFTCQGRESVYWLNAYEKEDPEYGQCFRICSDRKFWINDIGVYKAVNIRLIK